MRRPLVGGVWALALWGALAGAPAGGTRLRGRASGSRRLLAGDDDDGGLFEDDDTEPTPRPTPRPTTAPTLKLDDGESCSGIARQIKPSSDGERWHVAEREPRGLHALRRGDVLTPEKCAAGNEIRRSAPRP